MALATSRHWTGGRRTGDQLYDARRAQEAGVNVGTMERWLSIAAGGALAAYAIKRRHASAGAAALAGTALLHRGTTGHCAVYQAMGVNRSDGSKGTGAIADQGSDTRQALGGAKGIHVEASITVRRPIAEVYRFWRNFENLPRFMTHLRQVSMREAGVSRWVAKGPAGMDVEWDARIINEIDNKVIGWQSLEGSTISTAGSVNFTETALGTTVRVHFQYQPPAGRLGDAVARLFGEDPNTTVREDLERLKALLES